MGLSPHLCFGGRGFESTTLVLWGCGFQSTIFFFFFFGGGGGGGGVESFLLLGRGWEFFLKFCLVWVVLVLLCFLRFFCFLLWVGSLLIFVQYSFIHTIFFVFYGEV